jgi:hypothetical protein
MINAGWGEAGRVHGTLHQKASAENTDAFGARIRQKSFRDICNWGQSACCGMVPNEYFEYSLSSGPNVRI